MIESSHNPVIPGEPKAREGDPDLPTLMFWIPFPRLRLAGDDGRAGSAVPNASPVSGRVTAICKTSAQRRDGWGSTGCFAECPVSPRASVRLLDAIVEALDQRIEEVGYHLPLTHLDLRRHGHARQQAHLFRPLGHLHL